MFKILQKELKTFFKDRRAVMLGILMPIILITVFSLAFGGLNGKSDNKISVLVSDEDKSATTKLVIAGLDSVKALEIATSSTDSALVLVKAGKYPAALIFHKGFGDSVKEIKHLPWELRYDAAQSIEMEMMQQYLMQNLFSSVGKMMSEKMVLRNTQKQFVGMDSLAMLMATLQVKKSIKTNSADMDYLQKNIMKLQSEPVEKAKDNQGIIQAVAGTAVMMLLFSLTAMGGRLLEEKESGTLKRLLCSPLTSNAILNGKLLSSMVFAVCQLFIMLIYSTITFGLVLWPKIVPVILLVVATAYACAAFGMFLASVVKSREQLQGTSTLCILIMSAIGGSMVPSFLMPSWMQTVGHLSINYWSIQGFYDIFWRQLPINNIVFLEKVGVLTGIGLCFSVVSFGLFRRNIASMA